MRDTVLYQHLLDLEAPSTVEKVELDVKSQRVDVWVGHPRRHRWPCPECGTACSLYDHAPERMWRRLVRTLGSSRGRTRALAASGGAECSAKAPLRPCNYLQPRDFVNLTVEDGSSDCASGSGSAGCAWWPTGGRSASARSSSSTIAA